MVKPENFDEKTINDVLDRIRDNYKYLNEDEFNIELILGSASDSLQVLNKKMEEEIQFVKSHPDSKQRFEIITSFLDRLESEKSFDIMKETIPEHDFLEIKKITQNWDILFENYKKFGNSDDMELSNDVLCKMYAYNYEDVCKFYLKLFARIIKGKKIDSCGICIDIILKY
ncbi:MAG: hypothetical protein ACR2LL_06750 [Nitrosopumilus sp.]